MHAVDPATALELLGAADRAANELTDLLADDARRHHYDHGINVRAAERYVAAVRDYGALDRTAVQRAAGDRLAHRAAHHLAELNPRDRHWLALLEHWHARYGCDADELAD